MRYYETLYLINPNLSDEDCKGVVEKFNKLIEKNKGELIKVDEWGKKPLAYTVKKFDKGYYVLLKYCGGPEIIEELKRDLKLDDRVLKHQTIKLEDDVNPELLTHKMSHGRLGSVKERNRADRGRNEAEPHQYANKGR